MTEEPEDTGGTVWDAPNQQAVGLDPPWVEGTGGGGEAEPKGEQHATKADLLEKAQARGLDVSEHNTKAEIQAALDENDE
jgi:hypothetical protein